jgi:formate-nitrite transporter family protein
MYGRSCNLQLAFDGNLTVMDEFKLPVPVSDSDHSRGPVDAPVVIVKYGDFECPHCAIAHRTFKRVVKPIENSVRFIFRHFPLTRVHPNALRAAEASEAAGAQGKFWPMYDELFFGGPDKLDDHQLRRYANKIGLDIDRFDQELNNHVYAPAIEKEYRQSIIWGITGTPTFYINEDRFDRSSEPEVLAEYIQSLIASQGIRP